MLRYFINNGIAVTVLALTILLFGTLAAFRLPIQLTPNVQQPAITVTTIYPGATPKDVELDIIVKQEEFLRSITGLKKMTSKAQQGMAEIILEFAIGTNMSENLVRVNNALSQVSEYPENVDEPSLSTSSSSDQPVAWFSLRALPGRERDVNIIAQQDFAEDNVKTAFERIPGVASVQGVYGGSPEQMQVYLDPYKLAERGVTIYQVRTSIRENNRDVPGGSMQEGKRNYNLRTVGRFSEPSDVERNIITYKQGTPITIGDVGYARLATAKQNSLIRHNGRDALAMGIRHQPGTNLLDVMAEVKDTAQRLNDTILKDRGLFITQVTDDTEYVRDSVAMVRNNLATGGVLALITLLLFLRHVRSALIVGTAVPLCMAGALILVAASGRTINVITLAGLAFSIGAVLDSSIVVLENIYRHRTMGKPSMVAAVDGTEEVWTALISSTATNVIVFIPILSLQDEAGQLFRDMAIAITATNVFALINALLIVPCLAALLLTKMPGAPKSQLARRAYHLFGMDVYAIAFARRVEDLLRFLLASTIRQLSFVLFMAALTISLFFIFLPRTEYLPEGNQNSIFAFLIPPQGYGLNEMSAIGRELETRMRPYVEATQEDYLRQLRDPGSIQPNEVKLEGPPIKDFFFVSFGGGMFIFTRAKDPNYAHDVPPLIRSITGQVPGVFAISSQQSVFSQDIAGSRGIEMNIIGPDMGVATGVAAQAFGKAMGAFPGGNPPNPEPGIEVGQPQLTIRPKWQRAAEVGIAAQDIGYGAWVLGDGAYADDFYDPRGKKMDLYLYSTLGAFDTLANFQTLRIATSDGRTFPLSDVVDVNFDFVPQQIRRLDEERAVTLTIIPPADIALEDALRVVSDDIIAALHADGAVPPGYRIEIGGSSDKLANIRDKIGGEFLLALLLVYLIMVLIFRNWGHPFTILLAVPVGLSGGVVGLAFLNGYLKYILRLEQIQALDVLTMLGFLILLGSIVNNPILIVEQALNFMEQGMEQREAIIQSALTRIRPIFMTTGTTILGLSPLVLVPGAGTELYRGLGVVNFGGLLLGTITTLFLIPCLMALFFRLSEKFRSSRFFSAAAEQFTDTTPAREP